MVSFIYLTLVWLFLTISLITKGTVKYFFLGMEIGVLIGQMVWFCTRRLK